MLITQKYGNTSRSWAAIRQDMLGTIKANADKAVSADPVIVGAAHGFDTTYNVYTGGCMLPGNRALFAPGSAQYPGWYDIENDAFLTSAKHGESGINRFGGATLVSEDYSILIPNAGSNFWLFRNDDGLLEKGPGKLSSYRAGVLSVDAQGDDVLVCIPSAAEGKIAHLRLKDLSLRETISTGLSAYFARLMPNGSILTGQSSVLLSYELAMYDPVSEELLTYSGLNNDDYSDRSLLLTPDNSLIGDGSYGSRPRKFRMSRDYSDITVINGPAYSTALASGSKQGINLFPNGEVCIGPYNGIEMAILNLNSGLGAIGMTEITANLPATDGMSSCVGVLMSPSGDNILIPGRMDNVRIVRRVIDAVGFSEQVCCSPFFGSGS